MPRSLALGNGSLLVDFDDRYRLRDVYYPHAGQENHTLGHPQRLGVVVSGVVSWLDDEGWTTELDHVAEAAATDVRLSSEALALTVRVRDTVTPDHPVLLRELTVVNASDEPRSVRLLLHHDLHILESDVSNCVRWDRSRRVLLHYKKDRWFLLDVRVGGTDGVDEWTVARRDDHDDMGSRGEAGLETLTRNAVAMGAGDSMIAVTLPLAPGSSERVWAWCACARDPRAAAELDEFVRTTGPDELFERSVRASRAWVRRASTPLDGLDEELADLFRRSLLTIRTQIDHGGAIIASCDAELRDAARDTYAYLWPRDGAFVAHALSRAGYTEEADRFFDFCRRIITDGGYLLQRYHPDGSLGSTWHVVVDEADPRLPIQEDETALVIWALAEHLADASDADRIDELFHDLIEPACEFMVSYRHADTGLPLPSHDLWEERLGIHTFTCCAVIAALRGGASIAERSGRRRAAARWREAADGIAAAVEDLLFHEAEGRYARMATPDHHLDMTVDASLAGLFMFGEVTGDQARVAATMRAVEERLRVRTPIGGHARYEDDHYHQVSKETTTVPGNPWILCTLWVVDWQVHGARAVEDLAAARDGLLAVARGAMPGGILPEQRHPFTGAPLSVSPLTWSHSTFVLSVAGWIRRRIELERAASPTS